MLIVEPSRILEKESFFLFGKFLQEEKSFNHSFYIYLVFCVLSILCTHSVLNSVSSRSFLSIDPGGQLFHQGCFFESYYLSSIYARNSFCFTLLFLYYMPFFFSFSSVFCQRTSSNRIGGCKSLASLSSSFLVAVEKSKDFLIPNSLFMSLPHQPSPSPPPPPISDWSQDFFSIPTV